MISARKEFTMVASDDMLYACGGVGENEVSPFPFEEIFSILNDPIKYYQKMC